MRTIPQRETIVELTVLNRRANRSAPRSLSSSLQIQAILTSRRLDFYPQASESRGARGGCQKRRMRDTVSSFLSRSELLDLAATAFHAGFIPVTF